MSTTGDPLNAAQQTAFENYIRGGGGYVGVHAAADTEYEWPFYGQLVGAYFQSHPAGTPTATVRVDDADHHSTLGLPNPWPRVDEWYNYQSPVNPTVGGGGADYSPRGQVHVLLTVDETTYEEGDGNTTDDDHPISWCQRYEGGRSWYTGMGHTAASFSEPDFRKHLLGGLEVASGAVADADCGNAGRQPPADGEHPAQSGGRRLSGRPGGLHGDRDRSGRRHAHLRVGLRRRRHRDHQGRDAHLHRARRLVRQGHGPRRQRAARTRRCSRSTSSRTAARTKKRSASVGSCPARWRSTSPARRTSACSRRVSPATTRRAWPPPPPRPPRRPS